MPTTTLVLAPILLVLLLVLLALRRRSTAAPASSGDSPAVTPSATPVVTPVVTPTVTPAITPAATAGVPPVVTPDTTPTTAPDPAAAPPTAAETVPVPTSVPTSVPAPSAPSCAPPGAVGRTTNEAEEVRLLRLQVATLTEALNDSTTVGPARPTGAQAAMSSPVEHRPGDDEYPTLGFVPLGRATAAEIAAAIARRYPEAVAASPRVEPTAPVTPVTPVPVAPVVAPPVASTPPQRDRVAEGYLALSQELAGAGRLREAALTQWAADLRALQPLLEGREQELYDALQALAPADVAGAVTAARSVAASLLGPEVDVRTILADARHLGDPHTPATAATRADVSADVLSDDVVRALEGALVSSADRSGDDDRISVGLRCDLVAHLLPAHAGRPADPDAAAHLVRSVLEPHERPTFDADLAGRAS